MNKHKVFDKTETNLDQHFMTLNLRVYQFKWRNGASHIGSKGGKRRAAVVISRIMALLFPPPFFSPRSPIRAHHSAANAVSERNPLRKAFFCGHKG